MAIFSASFIEYKHCLHAVSKWFWCLKSCSALHVVSRSWRMYATHNMEVLTMFSVYQRVREFFEILHMLFVQLESLEIKECFFAIAASLYIAQRSP